ncbi:MAG: D-alanyl-D-alanine carboxypeptidase family protein [Hyphomicrobiaceae bacterium]
MRLDRYLEMVRYAAAWLAVAAVMLCLPLRAEAASSSEAPTRAPHAILMDADTGAILLQRDADTLVPPASMSKLMTLAVAFKAIKAGQLKLDDEFLMSEHAWRTGGAPSGTSAMFVPVNTKATLEELIKGITVQSGNDAAIAIAEGMAGSEAAFAKLMTDEARRIGLPKSTFRNPTGLYDPGHLMTVRELALLARYIIHEYPQQYAYFGLREFPYRKHKFFNRNPLLSLAIGVDGLKTGYVKESGYGMVASAKQENRRLIAVVAGLPSAAERKDETARLLEWGFKSFSEFTLFDAGEVVGEARVWGGERFYVPLTGAAGPVTVLLPRATANQRLRAEIRYQKPLKPPIKKGETVAVLKVTAANDTINEVPLKAAEDVDRAGVVRRGLDSLFFRATRWIP